MHSKNEQLVHRLIEVTQSGKLTWEPDAKPATYVTSMINVKLSISVATMVSIDDLFGKKTYTFIISDLNNEEIDSVTAVQSKSKDPFEVTDYELLGDLHETARRSAKNIDQTIDNILEALNDD